MTSLTSEKEQDDNKLIGVSVWLWIHLKLLITKSNINGAGKHRVSSDAKP